MSSRKKKAGPRDVSFEEAVAEVEAIIDRIESGEMGLEEQIEQYARGAGLLKNCRSILRRCEQRVEEISADLESGEREGATGGEGPASDEEH